VLDEGMETGAEAEDGVVGWLPGLDWGPPAPRRLCVVASGEVDSDCEPPACLKMGS
jgi:hypothetical protein